MFDPAVDLAGTYTYTITNSCGTSNNDVVVTVASCAVPTAGFVVSDNIICEGDCINITDQSVGANLWQWTFNGGTPGIFTSQNPGTVCFSAAGTYTIEQIVVNSNGSDTATTTIIVNTAPIIDLGNDKVICKQITVLSPGTGFDTYLWSDGSTNSSLTTNSTGTYGVTVTNIQGCSTSDEIAIVEECPSVLWIPNIFTPNEDGINDTFNAKAEYIESYTMSIFNRWGQLLFQTNSLEVGWNGRLYSGLMAPTGTYIYLIKYSYKIKMNLIHKTKRGHITLLK